MSSEQDEQGEIIPRGKRHKRLIAWYGIWYEILVPAGAVGHVKVIEHAIREVLIPEASEPFICSACDGAVPWLPMEVMC